MTADLPPRAVTIGVLGLQGDVVPHARMLEAHEGVRAVSVRDAAELAAVDGLVLPGGESTTIGKLLDRHALMQPLRDRIAGGLPVFGTCAGMILLARDIEESDQHRIGAMDITVARNAFGRQVDSFEADIPLSVLGGMPVRGVFIRAPFVRAAAPGVEVLAVYDGRIVAVRQGALLAIAFHPELTADARMHGLFIDMVRAAAPA